jgi:hypothetical protein
MIWGVSESRGAPYLAKKHPGRLVLAGMFVLENAVILSPFYPTRAKPNTTTIPSGDKKGEGSSRAFTSCKKPSAIKDRFLLGPRT